MDVVGVPYTLTGLLKGQWVRFATGIWVLAAVGLSILLIGIIIRVNLLSPWTVAAVIALICACTLGVYTPANPPNLEPGDHAARVYPPSGWYSVVPNSQQCDNILAVARHAYFSTAAAI
jgi:hypothetical protein